MRTRKSTVFVQIERQLIVRTTESQVEGWCDLCGCHSRFVPREDAATLAAISSLTLCHWLERGTLHGGQAPTGEFLICLSSLVRGAYQNAKEENSKWNAEQERK